MMRGIEILDLNIKREIFNIVIYLIICCLRKYIDKQWRKDYEIDVVYVFNLVRGKLRQGLDEFQVILSCLERCSCKIKINNKIKNM